MLDNLIQWFRRLLGKWLRKKGALQPAHQSEELAAIAAGRAGVIHNHPRWKEIMRYDGEGQTREDFVLNELIAYTVIFTLLEISERLPYIPGERRTFWREVRDGLFDGLISWLRGIGVDEEHAAIWRRLLEMRYEEYLELMKEHEAEIDRRAEQSGADSRDAIRRLIATVSAGAMMHIKQGEHHDTDVEATRLIQEQFADLHNTLVPRVGW
jgi:hypothetical protein